MPLVVRWPGRAAAGASSDQLICLTDLLATCAGVVGADLPANGAEDSLSFLPALRGRPNEGGRTSLVSHSNHGEFAYRDGPWKLVFKLGGRNLQQSRGKPTVAELYNLEADIAEQHDLAQQRPDVVKQMTEDLQSLIQRGSSRPGQQASNDTLVRFDATQTQRWAPARE